ncbi:MAG: peptidoglycan DD-metalloendopeptidase family protein [Bdellovibrionales bacterium]
MQKIRYWDLLPTFCVCILILAWGLEVRAQSPTYSSGRLVSYYNFGVPVYADSHSQGALSPGYGAYGNNTYPYSFASYTAPAYTTYAGYLNAYYAWVTQYYWGTNSYAGLYSNPHAYASAYDPNRYLAAAGSNSYSSGQTTANSYPPTAAAYPNYAPPAHPQPQAYAEAPTEGAYQETCQNCQGSGIRRPPAALGRIQYQQASLSPAEQRGTRLYSQSEDFIAPLLGYSLPHSDYGHFGHRCDRRKRNCRPHKGIDLDAERYAAVHATKSGTVEDLVDDCRPGDHGCGGGYGNRIKIRHPDGTATLYAHLDLSCMRLVSMHQTIRQGEKIACVGNTGHVVSRTGDGSHLHYEIHDRYGRPQDPRQVARL